MIDPDLKLKQKFFLAACSPQCNGGHQRLAIGNREKLQKMCLKRRDAAVMTVSKMEQSFLTSSLASDNLIGDTNDRIKFRFTSKFVVHSLRIKI